MRAGTWNLKVGRNRQQVKREVELLIREEGLDVLAVQEASWYDAELARIVGFDYFTTRGKSPSARDAGILVRHGHRTRGYRLTRTRTRWTRRKYPDRGLHPARSIPSVKVDGIRFPSVHMPPGPHDDPRNRLAYAECVIRLLVLLRGRGPFCAPGDYNKTRRARGPFSPHAIAQALRAQMAGDGIDLVLSRGVTVTDLDRGPRRGSDHAPVLFTVRKAR